MSNLHQLGRNKKLDPVTMLLNIIDDHKDKIENIVLNVELKDGSIQTYASELDENLLSKASILLSNLSLMTMNGEIDYE